MIERANPGQAFKPKASTWNRFREATLAYEATRSTPPPDGAGRQWLVLVLNNTGAILPRFSAVELGAPISTPEQSERGFDGLKGFHVDFVADAATPGRAAITQEPIHPDRVGRALIYGVSPVDELQVESESHLRAGMGPMGQAVSAESGPLEILWKSPDDGGPRRAIVAITQITQGVSTQRFARITGSEPDGPNRWTYAIEFVSFDEDTFDWEVDTSTEPTSAINTLEAGNSSSGIQGNGVDTENIPGGFMIVPVGEGAVVRVQKMASDLWAFEVANLVDGQCTT